MYKRKICHEKSSFSYYTMHLSKINKNVFPSNRNRIKIIHSANDNLFINYILFIPLHAVIIYFRLFVKMHYIKK